VGVCGCVPWGVSLGVHSVLEVHQLACGTCVEADETIPSVPEPQSPWPNWVLLVMATGDDPC